MQLVCLLNHFRMMSHLQASLLLDMMFQDQLRFIKELEYLSIFTFIVSVFADALALGIAIICTVQWVIANDERPAGDVSSTSLAAFSGSYPVLTRQCSYISWYSQFLRPSVNLLLHISKGMSYSKLRNDHK